MQGGNRTSHWTEELFIDHPELFLKDLEERVSIASNEVNFLLKYLDDEGFKPHRILDLNCGIGRHSIELGKRGINVLGTDLSPYYIQIAKNRAKNQKVADKVHFKVADMRKIASALAGQQFDGIVNLYTSFGFYDEETNADILRQCLSLVRPNGFFALDIMNRDWIVRNFQPRGFTRHDKLIILEDRTFDPTTSRMKSIWTCLIQKDDKNFILKKQVTIDHRLWSLHELIDTFQKNGWTFKAAYPGLMQQQEDFPLIESHRLLFIATNSQKGKKHTEEQTSPR